MRFTYPVILLCLIAALPVSAQPKAKGKTTEVTDKALAPWITQVTLLPGEEQVAALEKKLPDLNPDYRGQKLDAVIKDGVVRELKLPAFYLRDIRPLKVLRGLEKLETHGSPTQPSRIADLACLAGMKLQSLSIGHTAIADLSPLKGMPLHTLWCKDTKVRDIAVLKDMPLERLSLPGGVPPAQVDQLKGKVFRTFVGTDLGLTEKRMKALFANAELETFIDAPDPALTTLEPLRGMPLKQVIVSGTRVKSLDPFAGAKALSLLEANNTLVDDLSPLRGLPIGFLTIEGCRGVKDLSPVLGKKSALYKLHIGDTGITDLTLVGEQTGLTYLSIANLKGIKTFKPLAGLKNLKGLGLDGTVPEDKNYSPLAGLPVDFINIDLNPKTIAVLKLMPKLETVNGRKAADVLK